MEVKVIGAGLAGCEAAWQLAKRGIKVKLYDMKPHKYSPAHNLPSFCELVCSNSLRSDMLENAVGLLKEEMRQLGSLVMECADATRLPAGGALAVDRVGFSKLVTQKLTENENIEIINEEVTEIDTDEYTIVASGPLTSDMLYENILKLIGKDYLHFFDAAAPIVTTESIDMSKAYKASRYGRGTDDYINCPMTEEEYSLFYDALVNAETAHLHDEDKKTVFEGCMPVEVMAKRGRETLLFGPLKPVGLENPKDGKEPYAVVQLRQDNKDGTLYNIVGFQTHLKFGEQKRVFSLIPGLANAEFVRYGVMHRNTFINSPKLLNRNLSLKKDEKVFFAGQLSGVEGYMESAASGIIAGINAVRYVKNEPPLILPKFTMIGALLGFITDETVENFQPMGANFGIIPPLETHIRDKKERYEALANRALSYFEEK